MGLIDLYRANRGSFSELGRSLSDDDGAVVVPATPAWTVKDNLAHMSGVAADILAGRLDGVATDRWTEVQVRERSDWTIVEILEEWDRLGPEVETALAPIEDLVDPRLVVDLWTHEQDVRGALGRPGGDRRVTVEWMTPIIIEGWVKKSEQLGLPSLRVESGGTGAGQRDAAVVLVLDSYEAARVVTGRRSVAQVCGYEWSGTDDPSSYIPALVAFTPATSDLHDA